MGQNQVVPAVGEDVSHLMGGTAMPAIGEDVSALMQQPMFHTENAKDDKGNAIVSAAKDFAGELHSLNPVDIKKALDQMFWHPIDTAKGMLTAQDEVRQKAHEALKRGDYGEAIAQGIYWMLPLIGPRLSQSDDMLQRGEYAKGTGAIVDAAAQVVAPEVARRIPSIQVPALARNVNAAERAAVDFGMREGIPVDVPTATGNPVLRGAQKVADHTSLTGSFVGRSAGEARAQGFGTVGDRLAARANPLPVTAQQAGQAVTDAVSQRAADLTTDAGNAYTKLRNFEQQQAGRIQATGGIQAPATSAKPFTNVPLAVDITPTKAAMKSTYDGLLRKKELVGSLMGDEARALTSLDALMQAPDMAPLSVADAALSDLKSLSRVDQAFRRTTGQGVAAQAVASLDRSVVAAAKQFDGLNGTAKGGAFDALMDGRAATVNKYKAIDVLDSLRKGGAEPVAVFNQLTASKDSAIALLRRVQREAPKALPQLGRAYLEGLLEKAKASGGFGRTDGIFNDWQRLGADSKQMLFRDPGLVKDLDSFFLLAKKAAENPNPSGSAYVGGLLAHGYFFHNPVTGVAYEVGMGALSKALHSPSVARAMVRGMRMPLGNKAGVAAVTTELATAARNAGISLTPVPLGAGATPEPPAQTPSPAGPR
jgi:hypothetical protein